MRYLVKLATRTPMDVRFEEVSEGTFKNRHFAINEDGVPRYENDEFVIMDGAMCRSMQLTDMNASAMGQLMRHLQISIPTGLVSPNFLREVDVVRFLKRGKTTMITASGEEFVLTKKAA